MSMQDLALECQSSAGWFEYLLVQRPLKKNLPNWMRWFRLILVYQINGWSLYYVSSVSHDRTGQSDSFNLRTSLCKTSTFQASYFNRIVKLRNYVCKLAPPTIFFSPNAFQLFVRKLMSTHLSRVYDLLNYPRTWKLVQTCSCHSWFIPFSSYVQLNAFVANLGLIPGRCLAWDFVPLHLPLLSLAACFFLSLCYLFAWSTQ